MCAFKVVMLASVMVVMPAMGMAAQPASLHDRLQAAYVADPSPVYLPEGQAQLKALYEEALRTKNLPPEDMVRATLLYAVAVNEKGDAEAGLGLATDAEAFLQKTGQADSMLMGEVLRDKSIYQTLSGQVEAALETQAAALVLTRKYNGAESPEAGKLMCSMAYAYGLLGLLGDALAYYDAGLKLMSGDHDANGKYTDPGTYSANLGNYAGQLRLAGDPEKSLVYSREALRVAYQMPEGDRGISWGMMNIASSLLNMGRYAEAESLFREAMDFSVKYGGKVSYETGSYSYSLARALIRQGKTEEGEVLLQNALEIFRQVKIGSSPYLSGTTLNILGQLAYEQGDTAKAETYLNESFTVLAALGKRGEAQKATVQADLALVFLAKKDWSAALAQVDQALVYFQREKPAHEKGRVSAETLRALILSRMGRHDDALLEAARTGAVMRARLTEAGVSKSDQSDTALSYGLGFTRIADIALSAGKPEQAFEAAQLAAFSEIAATSQAVAAGAALSDPQAAALMQDLASLQEKRQQLDRERSFALGKSESEVTRLGGEIATADAGLEALRARLADIFPQYARLSQPQPVTIAAAAAGLAKGQAVMVPLASDDRTISLVLTVAGLTWEESPLGRTMINKDVRLIRESVDADPSASGTLGFNRAPAYELGRALFSQKTLDRLKSAKEVQILGAGPIMSLPFGLLLTKAPQGHDDDPAALRDSDWLIRAFAISVKSTLAADSGPAKKIRTGGFAGIGAPLTAEGRNGQPAWPALPQSVVELQAINAALNLPDSTLFTGLQATKANLKSAGLDRYSVIAFATHGLVSGDLQTLREPALVMTASGEDDDLLTASEIAGLRLKADWVILSACNTGSAREAGGAGYSGLARAFRQAGARNVLVSLWPVRDDVASTLSVATVRQYAKGQSQAQALRTATLALIKDRAAANAGNPVVWAAFSLVAP
ncbi:MAG TPA: CHAT domain-containing tetratricopeptide repeat protein [Asticcacaulis sp.]|nr:CHAT domain-containing tetratricopeptide repeat protein [Asticcacaulis sp.]